MKKIANKKKKIILSASDSFSKTVNSTDLKKKIAQKGFLQISCRNFSRPFPFDLQNVFGVVVSKIKFGEREMTFFPNLKVVSPFGVGVDHIDLFAAKKRGVVVTNSGGASARAVAEHAIAHMLGLARRISEFDQRAKGGVWDWVFGMNLFPNLKTIARHGIGYDKVDTEAARVRGIVLTRTPKIANAAVADLAIAMIQMLTRNVLLCHLDLVERWTWDRRIGRTFSEITVGFVGLGGMGREIPKRLRVLGVKHLVGWNRSDRPEVQEARTLYDIERSTFFDYVALESDVVVVGLEFNPNTKGKVDRRFLLAMKQGSFFVNIGRGETVDEEALIEFLEDGRIAGAALDVYAKEPSPTRDENFGKLVALAKQGRVILTPHYASYTEGTVREEIEMVTHNLLGVLSGNLEGVEIVT